MKHKVGDFVKVTQILRGHGFKIGETIEILEVRPNINYLARTTEKWAITEEEVQLPKPKTKTKNCSDVLKLMDKDYSYSEAFGIVCTLNDVQDYKPLEEELGYYI